MVYSPIIGVNENKKGRSLMPQAVKKNTYERFLNVLISPHTKVPLIEKDNQLVTKRAYLSKNRHTYPIINGIPVLVLQPEALHLTPPEPGKISRNIPTYKVPKANNKAKLVLHHGSGNVACDDPRVISMDILPCENVDVVAEAECLPFADNTFDLVESGAVFEHLYDPIAAIKEIRRVLKPGGMFRIDNSFLQPYHGFPGHYYAMTPQANETYLVDDFILLESAIPDSGTPLMTLSMMIDRFLLNLSQEQKKAVMTMKLEKFLALVKQDLTSNSPLMKDFSEYEKRGMAATHIVAAKKPEAYEQKLAALKKDPLIFEKWIRLKREYYTLRTEVMLRDHEIYTYKRYALDIDSRCKFAGIVFPEPVDKTLKSLTLKDPLDVDKLQKLIEKLRRTERTLVETRDKVIRVYLDCRNRAEKKAAKETKPHQKSRR